MANAEHIPEDVFPDISWFVSAARKLVGHEGDVGISIGDSAVIQSLALTSIAHSCIRIADALERIANEANT